MQGGSQEARPLKNPCVLCAFIRFEFLIAVVRRRGPSRTFDPLTPLGVAGVCGLAEKSGVSCNGGHPMSAQAQIDVRLLAGRSLTCSFEAANHSRPIFSSQWLQMLIKLKPPETSAWRSFESKSVMGYYPQLSSCPLS